MTFNVKFKSKSLFREIAMLFVRFTKLSATKTHTSNSSAINITANGRGSRIERIERPRMCIMEGEFVSGIGKTSKIQVLDTVLLGSAMI